MLSPVILGALLALSGAPQRPAPAQIRIPFWAEARAADAPALTVRDLTVKLGGEPARILSLRRPKDDLVVLLALDVTGDLSTVDLAKKALAAAISQLPSNVYVGVLRAQDGLRAVVDPTADRSAAAAAIENTPVSGKAALLDTVETLTHVADTMMSKSAARVAVFYVTDSSIYNYQDDYTNPVVNSSDSHDISRVFPEGLVKEKISRLDASLAAMQPPLFIVHLNYTSDRLNEAYQNGLTTLASASGGASTFCRSNAEISDAIQKIMGTIVSHYTLTIELPKKPLKDLQIQLESPERLIYRTRFTLKAR
jgi:hypothetical protein